MIDSIELAKDFMGFFIAGVLIGIIAFAGCAIILEKIKNNP